ncbi:hypothetical protein AMATHDRAFT_198725 [Amanita thiersii Skay4041]|uniref:Cytochrome P450 n=1 Tax=Amanita thiersii Skay4041 TaxID=703135 RepID=A0A2A9NFD8_9AGAR|nr:hypothetical protein AMATHDRAFT_198725 [Amanita thiersii Skay4041]
MQMTPGIRFLGSGLAYASLPIIGSTALQQLASKYYDIDVPTWVVVLSSVLAFPGASLARVLWKEIKDRRDAAAIGAQVVPKVRGKKVGNLDILQTMKEVWDSGYPGDGLDKPFEDHGAVFNMYIMYSDLVFTASPEHIKLMLATDFPNYVKGERFQRSMGSVLGTGVFNSDGEMWKYVSVVHDTNNLTCPRFHRSITRPVFTRDRISDFDLFDRHAEVAISQLKQRLREGYAVDFQDLMSRFTLDSATEFLFGNCVHSLHAGLPYPANTSLPPPPSSGSPVTSHHTATANTFAAAFLEAQEVISYRERYGWIWPLYEIFEDKTKKPMKVVDGYIEPIIKEAVEKKKARVAAGEIETEKKRDELAEGETLLDHLVQVTDDPKVLKDETLNIMIAGRDTTASTLTFVVYLLARYPHVAERLRNEVMEKVGPTRRPDFDDIKDMRYLKAVINETLRLYPIVPFNIRESINATTWPNPDPSQKPYYIPAGTKTAYSVFMMHRRTDLWGPDAEEFDPDRFLDDRLKKYLIKNSFIFLPFNAGPRICLGQQFAYNEMSFMLIRLLQTFCSVSLDPSSAPPESRPPSEWASAPGRKGTEQLFPKLHLTMYALGGLWVKMEEANEGSN